MANKAEKLAAITKDWAIKDGKAVRTVAVSTLKEASKVTAQIVAFGGKKGVDVHLHFDGASTITVSLPTGGASPAFDRAQRAIAVGLGRLLDRSKAAKEGEHEPSV